MTPLRSYLIRLISCGFLVSLVGSLPMTKHAKSAVRLCAGCLLLLTAVAPLLTLDGSSLLGKLEALTKQDNQSEDSAKQKHEELLRELVEAEVSDEIVREAAGCGAEVSVQVQTQKDAASGLYVPWQITLRGEVEQPIRNMLEEYLNTEWGIPPQRQRWYTE